MKNQNHWKYAIGLLIIPALLAYGIWRQHQLDGNFRFTVGVTAGQISTLKNGLQIQYRYSVLGKQFAGYAFKDERKQIIFPNGRYIVKYSESKPWISEISWKMPISKYPNAPADGWTKIPFEVKELQ